MPSDPLTLAFDTSAAHCAAALVSGNRIWFDHTEPMEKGQAERLMPMMDQLLKDQGFGWSDLDLIAVGTGPGNFTGIRIGVSAARGLALGLDIPVMGVSTFELMRGENSPLDPSPQIVSVPARGQSAFVALFKDGVLAGKPVMSDIHLHSAPDFASRDIEILGYEAKELAFMWATDGNAAPSTVADLIDYALPMARIAQHRWAAGEVAPQSPAPLYVRPANAAPSRQAAPVMLD